MDISGNKSVAAKEDEGTVVNIRDAEGNEQEGVTITVAGTYSSKYRRAVNAQRERMLKQRRTSLSGEALNRQGLDLIAASIVSWEGFTANGQPFPFTKDNAVALLEGAPWIREQVEEAMSDHAGFFKTASAS